MAGRARAFRVEAPGRAGIVEVALPEPGPGDVVVRTLHSAVSRGTETLVFRGEVPASQYDRMRAPFQAGDLPGPVVYGYLSVGVVEEGPGSGRTVFCLHPHQDRFVVPADAVVAVPAEVPPARAVLAGTVETAVNALWDAAPRVGDRVAVVGAGMVGASVAAVLASFPGVRVELVDVDTSRRAVADALGVGFATPDEAAGECDLVLHASASEAGLARSLELLGDEGEVVELSWYGERAPRVPLGEAFHSRRLAVRASQVGRVAPARRARWSTTDRLALALRLLADPRFDALITDSCTFDELPDVMAALAAGDRPGLAVRVDHRVGH
ncbi:zinc-dependent alcohol dehydrogenase [Actinomycetospora cinnamomea]|uniref:Threonine dehydrogenase-like Zn-dependent dehydrogenase n=1 Tax=Actinomycetospora cinnamomea TaxID=663609 RepID=A0A2U1EVF3_9PSEU|nr:zinc-binding alcohol dehydrogenase [Actinomycetospora cinnamomea]PVZ03923.1 threonine dehydrogenase-like Zn-dependent dehydrogenase [Actinomycetospora cinnamomea]